MNKWVSVRDELPDKDGEYFVTSVLTCSNGETYTETEISEYNKARGFVCETPHTIVTAWQEIILPKPYEENNT